VTVSKLEKEVSIQDRFIGVDLNTTGHVAVASDPEIGRVWKLGKEANHIALKYREIRKGLRRQGYRNVKQSGIGSSD
jgi:transposase